MSVNTELIVLHTTKFGENSIVLHTLSREFGRRGFLVRNVAKKPVMSLFQPLSILEADVTEAPASRLSVARNVVSRYPLAGIRNNISKNAMTMFISEVLYRVVKDGAMEPGLYDMCERDILLLDAMESDFSNYHLRFLLEFIIELGFSPEPADIDPFMGEYSRITDRFIHSSFSESMLIPLSGEVRNEMAERLLRYIEYHTESAVNVNSLKVLRELFSGFGPDVDLV